VQPSLKVSTIRLLLDMFDHFVFGSVLIKSSRLII
jgi:hypothetical protein